jgi:hypothetical protein
LPGGGRGLTWILPVNLPDGTQQHHDIRFVGRDSNRGHAEHSCCQVSSLRAIESADVSAFALNLNAITGFSEAADFPKDA